MTEGIGNYRIFVYGTLREDPAHDMYRVLARSATFVGDATANGRLYDLGAYPGLVLSSDPDSIVHGEVYELKPDGAAQVLTLLDNYEGCGVNDPSSHEYRRELVRVRLSNGEETNAWTYLLNRDPSDMAHIRGGDYLTWRKRPGAA